MTTPIEYDELADALSRIGCLQEAAEVHGGLCGALCAAAPGEVDLRRILDPAEDQEFQSHAPAEALLMRLCQEAEASLEDRGMGFQPMLPDDSVPLGERVKALSQWCEGFLYGIASHRELDLDNCSEALREIVHDLTELTQASVGADDNGEVEENAYMELVEYVRVGVQIVYIEMRGSSAGEAGDGPTLH